MRTPVNRLRRTFGPPVPNVNTHAPVLGSPQASISAVSRFTQPPLTLSADGRSLVGFGVLESQLTAYRVQFCYANCDESTTAPYLNIDDFTCFINRFAQAQSLPHLEQTYNRANCDGSTVHPVLNIDDFTCFTNRYAVGCETPWSDGRFTRGRRHRSKLCTLAQAALPPPHRSVRGQKHRCIRSDSP